MYYFVFTFSCCLKYVLIVVFCFVINIISINSQSTCREQDSIELIRFYNNFSGDKWKNDSNWMVPNMPIDSWYGISLNANGCVDSIILDSNGLVGSLNINFPEIIALNLKGNGLFGAVPSNIIDKMPKLEYLNLSSNELISFIPTFQGSMSLKYLILPNNNFTGFTFFDIPNLIELDLSDNDFRTDSINLNFPNLEILKLSKCRINNLSGLASLSSLTYLDISSNYSLTVAYSEISQLTNLTHLNISGNNMSGTLSELTLLPNLTYLDISFNRLTVAFSEVSQLTSLRHLNISYNNMSGALSELTSLPNLTYLDISFNSLMVAYSEISQLTNLTHLNISGNNMSGKLAEFSIISNLIEFRASSCKIQDSITTYFNSSKLVTLDMSNSFLYGSIPDFSSCVNLEFLDLSNNNLSGAIPNFFQNDRLIKLDLSDNQLEGKIPDFTNLNKLEFLSLYGNYLSGRVPELKGCSKLQWFNIGSNKFGFNGLAYHINRGYTFIYESQDRIFPDSTFFLELGDNFKVDLSIDSAVTNNNYKWKIYNGKFIDTTIIGQNFLFIDSIQKGDVGWYEVEVSNPEVPGLILFGGRINLYNNNHLTCNRQNDSLKLVEFFAATNVFKELDSWDIKYPVYAWEGIKLSNKGCITSIDLDYLYSNGFVQDLSNMPHLTKLSCMRCGLSGPVPKFSELPNLRYLNLSENIFKGPIQDFLGVPELEYLYLKDNAMIGKIPNFLNLTNLINIDFSYNQLEGKIPDFENLSKLELLDLSYNKLDEGIPNFLTNDRLKSIDFSHNQLDGKIPDFANLSKLEILDLSYNMLEEGVPNFLTNDSLKSIDFSHNQLDGKIPDFANLSKLEFLNLSSNKLSGALPLFSNLNIREIIVSNNKLKGKIPEYLDLRDLFLLDISQNDYTFEDILPIPNEFQFIRYNYSPQNNFYIDTLILGEAGDSLKIDLHIDSLIVDNEYSWTKNGMNWVAPDPNQEGYNFLIFQQLKFDDSGRYKVSVRNFNAPELTLYSEVISLKVCDVFQDSMELVSLYNALNGPKWANNSNWLTPGVVISKWYGVSVDSLGCVRNLNLSNNKLSGQLPDLQLTNLDTLNLSKNNLVGMLPEIGIPFIKFLDLSYNNLEGLLPDALYTWVDIINLNLSFNKFNDVIPPDLGDLCEAQTIRLNNNNLFGTLSDYHNLDNLLLLNLANNNFTGSIPNFSGMPKLEELYLNGNQLTGLIPDFQNLPEVSQFRFYDNLFSGLIPEFTGMPKLTYTDLHDNYYTFSDIIPLISGSSNYIYSPQYPFYRDTTFIVEIGDQHLIDLLIDSTLKDNVYHWFKDSIPFAPPPPNDSNSNKLIFASIQASDFGRYYVEVTNSRAPDLILRSRTIAIKVCNSEQDSMELVKLYGNTNGQNWINDENWLMDGVPIQSWYGISVDSLGCVSGIRLPDNGLTGDIGAIRLRALDSLDVSGNNLIGNISLWEFPFLKYYNVSQNQLTGSIDKPLTLWQDLEYLDLSDNLFTDSIPGAIGNLENLNSLFLANNEFKYQFPVELTKLQAIELGQLDFKNNLQTAEELDPKYIFFCPYGDQIFAGDNCFIPFQNLCNSICTGAEWDQLRNYPWMVDTLNAVKCSDSSCYETIIHAGNVEIRGIKLFFLRKRCFSDSTNNYYTEHIKYYNCNGALIEEGFCDSVRNCYSMGETITEEHIKNGFYKIKWSCGDSLKINTTVKDYEDNINKEKNKYKTLNCFPNPVIDLLQCKGFEGDTPKSLLICNTQGQVFNPVFIIHDHFVAIHVESLVPGFYFGELKGLKTIYQFKFIVL